MVELGYEPRTDDDEDVEFKWEIPDPGFTVRQWVDHFMFIYNFSKINVMYCGAGGEQYDTVSLREMAKGIDIETLVLHGLPMSVCYKLVSQSFLQAKGIKFHETSQMELEFFHKIVVQNLNFLNIFWDFDISLKLHDLIIIRIPIISYSRSQLSDQDLNRFLKLWMAGCNIELEKISFGFQTERVLSVDTILSGTNYITMEPQEQREKILNDGSFQPNYVVKGGYVIRRKDGVEATILVETVPNVNNFLMIVWA